MAWRLSSATREAEAAQRRPRLASETIASQQTYAAVHKMCGNALAESTFCCSRFGMALRQHIEGIDNSSNRSADVALVEAALRFGQRRDLILGSAFANPAWEIMLWLYSKALKDSDASLETLMAETERSNLTQRWIDALVQDGLVMIASPGGVSVVRLTTHGKASMDALFASAQAGTAVS